MGCGCGKRPTGIMARASILPGADGITTVFVTAPLALEVDGVYYDFKEPGEYFVVTKHAEQLLELDEVNDGHAVETNNPTSN